MRSSAIRLRRTYVPLTVGCTLRCATPLSPFVQMHTAEGDYQPDRTMTPCAIQPYVTASCPDGSWVHKLQANDLLADIVWTVDGEDIATAWPATDYEIVTTEGDTRGTLKVKRNFADTERHTFAMRGVIADSRRSENVPVASDEVTLFTTPAANDQYSLDPQCAKIIVYDPLKDGRLRYDYEKSHGYAVASSYTSAAGDYLNSFNVHVLQGKEQNCEGFTLAITRENADGTTDTLTAGECELLSCEAYTKSTSAGFALTFDNRLIANNSSYNAILYHAKLGNELTRCPLFALTRRNPAIKVSVANRGAITANETRRWAEATVRADGADIDHPELYYSMAWQADTEEATAQQVGAGQRVEFDVSQLQTGDEGWVELYCDVEAKGLFAIASDGTAMLTDSGGNILIFN